MTKQERQLLLIQRSNARMRMKETWHALQQLEELTKKYNKLHDKWRREFESADRKLALEDKLTVVKTISTPKPVVSKQLIKGLTHSQILELVSEIVGEQRVN